MARRGGRRYKRVVGLRLTDEAQIKLDRLCEATRRPRGDLMRFLIERAELALATAPEVTLPLGRRQAR